MHVTVPADATVNALFLGQIRVLGQAWFLCECSDYFWQSVGLLENTSMVNILLTLKLSYDTFTLTNHVLVENIFEVFIICLTVLCQIFLQFDSGNHTVIHHCYTREEFCCM